MHPEQVVAGFVAEAGEKFLHLLALAVLHLGLDLRGVLEELLVGRRIDVRAEQRLFVGLFRGGEDAVQAVVVARRDRIELVIVAARAGDSEAHEAAGNDIDAVVDDVVLVAKKTTAEREEAHRGERRFVVAERELVGGELLHEKLVERLVVVERADDVVAIRVGKRKAALGIAHEVALRVGVARDIEPEAAPAFAVARRGEKTIHDTGVGIGRAVFEKCLHLGGRRREAGEIVGDATEEGARVGGWSRRKFFRGELCEDEGVDGILDFGFSIFDCGDRGLGDGLEGPVLAGARHVHRGRFGGGGARVGRAHFHPLLKGGDFFRGEFAAFFFRRHLEVFVGIADGRDEETFFRIAGDEGGAGRAALEQRIARIEQEAALGFSLLRAVALVARLGEDRADLRLEELDVFGWQIGGGNSSDREPERNGREGWCNRAHAHAISSLTTLPWTSVRRKSRPAWL